MGKVFDISTRAWELVRPEITKDVLGKTLFGDGIKVSLIRVAPGGRFSVHQDGYGHLFYILGGEGVFTLEGKEHRVSPGLVVRVIPGEAHAYENTGQEDMTLISINLPFSQV